MAVHENVVGLGKLTTHFGLSGSSHPAWAGGRTDSVSYSESAPPSGPGLDQPPMGAHRSSSATQTHSQSSSFIAVWGYHTPLLTVRPPAFAAAPTAPRLLSLRNQQSPFVAYTRPNCFCHLPPQESRPVHSLALDSSHLHVPCINPRCPTTT